MATSQLWIRTLAASRARRARSVRIQQVARSLAQMGRTALATRHSASHAQPARIAQTAFLRPCLVPAGTMRRPSPSGSACYAILDSRARQPQSHQFLAFQGRIRRPSHGLAA